MSHTLFSYWFHGDFLYRSHPNLTLRAPSTSGVAVVVKLTRDMVLVSMTTGSGERKGAAMNTPRPKLKCSACM